MSNKGFFDLTDVLKSLSSKDINFTLIAVGALIPDDELTMVQLKQKFSEISEEKWFKYYGKVGPREVNNLLNQVDAVCLLSRKECQPLALIQAMCVGQELIVSDQPPIKATLGNYPARYIPNKSMRDLEFVLLDMVNNLDRERRLKHEKFRLSSLDARKRFSISNFVDVMESIFIR